MAYATQADLETRFGIEELAQLTDRVNAMVIDADIVARAIADAQAEIDGYLGARYTLPLASVPPVQVRVTSDLARYYLFDDRVTEAVRKRYEDAIRLLKAIVAGDVKLDAVGAPTEAAGVNEVFVSAPSRPQVFKGRKF